MIRVYVALAAVCVGAVVGVAAGCGSDDSGSTDSITLQSVETSTPTVDSVATTPPDEGGFPTGTTTTPNVYTTPPKTTPSGGSGGGNTGGSSAEQNFNNYCKQNPGACGD